MDISKLPPASVVPTAATPAAAATPERNPLALPAAPAPAAGSGIKPLDLASALKILISEVKLAFVEAGNSAALPDPAWAFAGAPDAALPQAARALVELLLNFVPAQDMPAEALDRAIAGMLKVMDSAAQNAIERVGLWRDTPASVPDALGQVQTLAADAIAAALAADVPAGMLMRPEWLGLVPRLAQLRRRLRRRRILLTDTDADHVAPELKPDPDAGDP